MKKQSKRLALGCVLLALLMLLCACHETPSQEKLYQKMFDHFESWGFHCQLQAVEEESEVPIYKASAWQKLLLNEEELLVYFDDSNRADYLSTFVDEERFGRAWRFGLRFVLVYDGMNETVLNALNAIVIE